MDTRARARDNEDCRFFFPPPGGEVAVDDELHARSTVHLGGKSVQSLFVFLELPGVIRCLCRGEEHFAILYENRSV